MLEDQRSRGSDSKKSDLALVRRLLPFLRPHAGLIFFILLTIVLLSGVNICLPLLIKAIINPGFKDGNGVLLIWLLSAMAAVYLARNLLFFISRYWSVKISEGLAFDLRRTLFEHIQGLGLDFHHKVKPGRLTGRLMGDVANVHEFFRDSLGTAGADALTVVLLLVVMFVTNWQLALFASAVLPLQVWSYYRMRAVIKRSSKAASEQMSVVHGDLVESFSAAEVVKSFGQEGHEADVFRESMEKTRKAQISQRVLHVRQKIVADLLVGLGYLLVLGYVSYLVLSGTVNWAEFSGVFVMFLMCLGLMYPRMAGIISEAAKFQRCLASLERVYVILDSRPAPKQSEPAADIKRLRGEIEFRNVCFSYDTNDKVVLHDISFRVPAGQTLAIAGPSGGGKSTLVNLLLRMFDPTSGEVLIDGVNYQHIRPDVLRRDVGVAFQECFLFNRSILENIRYARPSASQEEIETAAKSAHAHEFISRLPQGYETVVGDGGAILSRGEMQRIGLTRALLKEPRILILDEATSSVDSESERAILEAIEPIMKDRTTLMITHKQELIDKTEHLLVLGDAAGRGEKSPGYCYYDRSEPVSAGLR